METQPINDRARRDKPNTLIHAKSIEEHSNCSRDQRFRPMVDRGSVRARDNRQSAAFRRARGHDNDSPRINARVGDVTCARLRSRFFLRQWDNAISKNAAARSAELAAAPWYARHRSSVLPFRHRQRNKCLYTKWRRPEFSLSRRSPGSSNVCQRCCSDEREVSWSCVRASSDNDPTGAVRCGAVRCGAARYSTARRDAAWRGAAWRSAARHGGVRCSAVRSGAGQCTA